MKELVQKIVSGGQTGADRAALDFAIENNIPHGGWAPKGRLAEDGALDPKYLLKEIKSSNYAERTEKNVIDSDGTLILYRSNLTGGSLYTLQLAAKHRKPVLSLDLAAERGPEKKIRVWLTKNHIGVLNIAGPRASGTPNIYNDVLGCLGKVFAAH